VICPVDKCNERYNDANTLANHLEASHGNEGITKCPHCAFCLAINDEHSKDHWLVHHQDVCPLCVHVFTSIYGAQLWKKVHARQTSTVSITSTNQENNNNSLDLIVNGLSRKRPAPDDEMESGYLNSESDHSENMSVDSEHQDSDTERQSCKRSRKQSCPQKVVNIPDEIDNQIDKDFQEKHMGMDVKKRNRSHKCLRCPTLPTFPNYARLRAHYKTKHRALKKSGTNIVKVVQNYNTPEHSD